MAVSIFASFFDVAPAQAGVQEDGIERGQCPLDSLVKPENDGQKSSSLSQSSRSSACGCLAREPLALTNINCPKQCGK
jgi:hypothetical protein